MERNAPIGVMDSGVGGLSVVLSLRDSLPHENIIYYGDTANCPYGNRSTEELLSLSGGMLSFLQEKYVKCVALACNTTSALAETLRPNFSVPIITVAECAADAIAKIGLTSVGLIATVSTANSKIYENRIHAIDPKIRVSAVGSYHLASLVEQNLSDSTQIDAEIINCMDALLAQHPVEHVILGCTHYPLVLDRFQLLYPGIHFIDPAPYQAAFLQTFLRENDGLHLENKPSLTVYTTGDPQVFAKVCEDNGLSAFYRTEFHHIEN